MDAFLAREGFEGHVARELGLAGAREVGRSPGVVLAELAGGAPRPDPAFASQSLPDAEEVSGESVAALVRAVFESVGPAVDAHEGEWTLHSASPETEAGAKLASRAALVGKELLAMLRLRLRRAHKRLGKRGAILQVVLAARDAAIVSFASRSALASGFLEPSPWPLGRPEVPEDRTAPSSAYRKAEEAYLLLGEEPRSGETVADLGAAPGGWSWTALRRGAKVTAVDRAKLLPPVAGNVEHLRRDAFTWEPPSPVDWLLCDAIVEPEKTLELVGLWLDRRWCRRFVVNLKMRPATDAVGVVAKARAVFARRGIRRVRIKQLGADKTEVTAFGSC